MAADIKIRRWTGAGPTKTDITNSNTRANAADEHTTNDTTNPIRIPDTGTNYSYWVTTGLYADTLPSGVIDNIRWFTDGNNGFGTGVGCIGYSASGYVQATGTPGVTGDELNETNHTGLNDAPVDVFTLTEGSPLAIAGDIDSGDSPDTDFGDLMVYQITVADTASPGATNAETFTWTYDET